MEKKPQVINVGDVLVEFKRPVSEPPFKKITIKYPSRLDAACTDPGKLYSIKPKDNIFPTGQINFCVNICKKITVEPREDDAIIVTGNYGRTVLVKHAAMLMQKALNITTGFSINIDASLDLRHCGLGSSASAIQGVGAAINELYNNQIKPMDLIRYLAGNHAEEIDGDNEHLVFVQSVGGSGVCGHYAGGLIIMTGRAVPIVRVDLPKDLKIVFGIPNQYLHPDANTLITDEIAASESFKKASTDYSKEIAYRLLNDAIPELVDGNFKPMKEFIFDYRWDMGSIKNCSYAYPGIVDLAEKMRPLRNDNDIDFIFLSTAGPGFCIVTKDINKAENIFRRLDMKTFVTDIHNGKYQIIEKVK